MMESIFFYLFGGITLLAALNVVIQRKVLYSALSLVICLSSIAALYLALEMPFIASIQIIVYAGAIMVLFLFVIMLTDAYSAAAFKDRKKLLKYLAVLLAAAGINLLIPMLQSYNRSQSSINLENTGYTNGSVAQIGQILFTEYLLPFEITSILILIAIMGVIVLARKRS